MTFKLLLGTLAFAQSLLMADSTSVTGYEVKKALANVIKKYNDMSLIQEHHSQEINFTNQDIIRLKKEIEDLGKDIAQINKRLSVLKTDSVSIANKDKSATVMFYKVNVRAQPTINSDTIKQLDLCTEVNIQKCGDNSNSENWCKLKDGGYIRKNLLSFENKTIKINGMYNIRILPLFSDETKDSITDYGQEVNFRGMSNDGAWACLDEHRMLYKDAMRSSNISNLIYGGNNK